MAVAALLAAACSLADDPARPATTPTLTGARAGAMPASLRPAILQALNAEAGPEFAVDAERAASPQPDPADVHFRARNPAHGFDTDFTERGVRIQLAGGVPPLELTLAHYGRADRLTPAVMGSWQNRAARIERRSQNGGATINEWYVNGPLGLEQGFTVDSLPSGNGPLMLQLSIDDPWSVRASSAAGAVELVERNSGAVLALRELYASDADGETLPASLVPTSDGLMIRVDDDEARYPITIDPFVQQTTLDVAGRTAGDEFGFSVDLSDDGSTAIVGVPGRDVVIGQINGIRVADSGTAYVFVRDGQGWAMQAQLATGGVLSAEAGRRFGHAVALSGAFAFVSAPFEAMEDRPDAGAVWVFQRGPAAWSVAQKLEPGEGIATACGRGLAVDGATLVMACDAKDDIGVAYFFSASSGMWHSRGSTIFQVPFTIAAAGGTIFVGHPLLSEVSVRQLSGQTSMQVGTLRPPGGTPSDGFGASLVGSGDALLVAAPGSGGGRGAGYVFRRNLAGTWGFEAKLEPDTPAGSLLGEVSSVGTTAAGDEVVVLGNTFATPANVFRRTAGAWTREQPVPMPFGVRSLAIGIDPQSGHAQLLVGSPLASGHGTVTVYDDVPAPMPGPGPGPTPPTGGLTPPTLASPAVAGSTVQLTWTGSNGATSYHVRAGTAPGASNAFDGNVGPMQTLTATGVPNGSYFVRVHAVGAAGESGPSNEVRVDVGGGAGCGTPAAPANLQATVSGALVTLTWSAAPGASGYIVEAGSAAGLANLAVADTGPATTLMASAPPGTYFVRVRARNACGATAVTGDIVVQVN